MRWRVESKIEISEVCTEEEGIDLCRRRLGKCDTVEGKENTIVFAENSGLPVPRLTTLPIVTQG